jgi:hypothetical protein
VWAGKLSYSKKSCYKNKGEKRKQLSEVLQL